MHESKISEGKILCSLSEKAVKTAESDMAKCLYSLKNEVKKYIDDGNLRDYAKQGNILQAVDFKKYSRCTNIFSDYHNGVNIKPGNGSYLLFSWKNYN